MRPGLKAPAGGIRLELLGVPAVSLGGRPVRFDTRKAVALLALLAVSGHSEGRERLASLLWPGSDPGRARAALRRTLSVTASALPGALQITRVTVALAPAVAGSDIEEFARLSQSGDPADWERAAALYRDDFLAGFQLRDSPEFEEWQLATAEQFRLRLGRLLERLVERRVAQQEYEAALEPAQRWLSLDQLHEPAHQALLRIYAAGGRWSAAVRQYRSCVRWLDQELGVPPLSETTALYEAALAQRARTPEPAMALSAPVVVAPLVPLVGREQELERLLASWQAARGSGRAVALVGEMGVGKTTLLGDLAQRVEAGGAAVVQVRGHDGEGGITYSLAVDLLRGCVALRPDLSERISPIAAREASRLLPELCPQERPDQGGLRSVAALARLYGAVAETVAVALSAPEAPAGLLALDDLHFADPRSLDLIAYLLRRLGEMRLLVALAWTPAAEPGRLGGVRGALAELAQEGRLERIEVTPLDQAGVAQLALAMQLSEHDSDRLFAATGGLPLLVREYAQLLSTSGPEALAGVPPTVRQLVNDRLEGAGEAALQILTAAATRGGDFDADLARAVSGRGDGEVAEGLDQAVRQGLLAEQVPGGSGPPAYDFSYEVVRRLAYERNTWARRRLLHKRAADALQRRQERDPGQVAPARLAEHLERAGRQEEAAEWWWQAAARATSLYAHEEAHGFLGRALACGYPRLPLLLAEGETLTFLGRYQEALAALRGASAVNQDPGLGGQIERRLAEIHHRLGEWDLARAHLEAARRLLGPGEAPRRARLEADLALLAYRQRRFRQAASQASRALSQALSADEPLAAAQALNVLGMVRAHQGEAEAGIELLEQSLDWARRARDVSAQVAALNNLSRSLAQLSRLDQAQATAEQALRLGAELADRHRLAALHTNLADLLHLRGERGAADRHLLQSAQAFAQVDPEQGLRPEVWTLVEW